MFSLIVHTQDNAQESSSQTQYSSRQLNTNRVIANYPCVQTSCIYISSCWSLEGARIHISSKQFAFAPRKVRYSQWPLRSGGREYADQWTKFPALKDCKLRALISVCGTLIQQATVCITDQIKEVIVPNNTGQKRARCTGSTHLTLTASSVTYTPTSLTKTFFSECIQYPSLWVFSSCTALTSLSHCRNV